MASGGPLGMVVMNPSRKAVAPGPGSAPPGTVRLTYATGITRLRKPRQGASTARKGGEPRGPRQVVERGGRIHGGLEGELDGEPGREEERDPGVSLAAAQAGRREPERDATGDLGLAEDADG